MNSSSFQESLKGFNSQAAYTSSPFASTNPSTQENSKSGIFSGISGIFSSPKDTLPFSYADSSHTKTAAASAPNTKSAWVPQWVSSSIAMASSPSLNSTNASEQWFETFGLTRSQRYLAFGICLVASVFLFMLSMLHLPLVVLRPGKFVVPYCMASLFIFTSFGFLHGFVSYSKHLLSTARLPYSLWFMGSTAGTLYCALSLHSYLLTVLMALVQMAAVLVFIASYVPGGTTGISFMSSMIGSSIKSRFAPNSF
jgi:hypothetical protein